jgi:hypothetical protein
MTEDDQKSSADVLRMAEKEAAEKGVEAAAAMGTQATKAAIEADAAAIKEVAKAVPPIHPATTWQKVWVLILLILITLFLVWLAKGAVSTLDGYIQRQNEVSWQAPANLTMKPGPPTFWYDAGKNRLVHVGVIDEKKKLELLNLVTVTSEQPATDEMKSYWAAIDQLAFSSNQNLAGLLIGLLFLGGLAGALGAQLRSLVSFVGHACYTGQLDLVVWWPYFALRPFTGFLLGTVIVIVVQAGLFAAGGAPSGTLWWASIAFLAGFGDTEFTQRLRQLTRTLFGESK